MIVAFERKKRLNPFGTGQCLSTQLKGQELIFATVSIPLEQGSVFRHSEWANQQKVRSQSLWNRAVSFDQAKADSGLAESMVSIPLEQGSVFRR